MSADRATVLVIGCRGQIGRELMAARPPEGVSRIGLGHDDLDLTDRDAVRRVVDRYRPTLIVNAAAYTAVDRAESEPDAAFAVNADGPAHLAEAAAAAGSLARPPFHRLRVRRRQAGRLHRRRSGPAARRLRGQQGGRREGGPRAARPPRDPAHLLGFRHARHELRQDDVAPWPRARPARTWSPTSGAVPPGPPISPTRSSASRTSS